MPIWHPLAATEVMIRVRASAVAKIAMYFAVCAACAPTVWAQSAPAPEPEMPETDKPSIERRIDQPLEDADAKPGLPPDMAYGAYQRGYFLTAFAMALAQAKKGDRASQTLLGELLSRGLGVKQDLAEAAGWYQLAADAGDQEALYALGRQHLEGLGVEKNPAKAAEYFQKAGDNGHSVAWRELAYLILQGQGREKNPELAAAYMRKASRRDDMDAQFALAGLYMEGIGVSRNEAQAARWFAEAARNGHVAAQIEYAILLFNGRGVVRDEAVAARWFLQAANSDNPVAQMRIARLLVDGRGVEKNEKDAARWFLLARTKGLKDEFLEDWYLNLGANIRQAAEDEAQSWPGVRDRREQRDQPQLTPPATEQELPDP